MISGTLPSTDNFSSSVPLLSENVVISGRSEGKYSYPKHSTPYIYVSNPLTSVGYRVHDRPVTVSSNQFLLLSRGESLEITHRENAPMELVAIMFNDDFFQQACAFHRRSHEALLNDPLLHVLEEPYLPNVPHLATESVSDLAGKLRNPASLTFGDYDATLIALTSLLLRENDKTTKCIRRINAMKTSTREELYRRLIWLVTFMRDQVDEQLTLDDMAAEVSMNKFHLLENFKSLYGDTPLQYFRDLKLEKATHLLKDGHPVTDVCYRLGFESVGSFSNLFKKKFGVSPSRLAPKSPNFR